MCGTLKATRVKATTKEGKEYEFVRIEVETENGELLEVANYFPKPAEKTIMSIVGTPYEIK